MSAFTGRVALVTGANRGIGLETVRQLAQQGVMTLLGARDAGKGEAAAAKLREEGLEVQAILLDVDNPATYAPAVQAIEKAYGKLDILINNAGVMLDTPGAPISASPIDVFRQTFETNVFNTLGLTQAFLPLLRKSEAGRIVNLSSILGSNALHADPTSPIYDFKVPAYNISKAALNGVTIHLAYELKDTPIKVNSAHPGWVKTEMGGDNAPMEIADGAKTSVQLATLPADGPTGGFFHLGETLPW